MKHTVLPPLALLFALALTLTAAALFATGLGGAEEIEMVKRSVWVI